MTYQKHTLKFLCGVMTPTLLVIKITKFNAEIPLKCVAYIGIDT